MHNKKKVNTIHFHIEERRVELHKGKKKCPLLFDQLEKELDPNREVSLFLCVILATLIIHLEHVYYLLLQFVFLEDYCLARLWFGRSRWRRVTRKGT